MQSNISRYLMLGTAVFSAETMRMFTEGIWFQGIGLKPQKFAKDIRNN